MTDIEVIIDDLPVPVDADEWNSDQAKVTELVRKNRDEYRKKASAAQLFWQSLANEDNEVAADLVPVSYSLTSVKSATARTTYQGRTVNERTRQILEDANTILKNKRYGGETSDIVLVQGSYNGTAVSASAGTHAGGGAGDITAFNYANRVKVLRLLGVAAWYRPTLRNVWSAHIHFVVIGDNTASSGAKAQVTAYKNGRNGLANNAVDNGWRPYRVNIQYVTNASSGTFYAKQNTNTYTQPYGKSSKVAALKKNAVFTVIAQVKNAYGNAWGVNKNGYWVDMTKLTKTAPPKPAPTTPAPKKTTIRLATQNFAQNNSTGLKNWGTNRAPLVTYIIGKKPSVLLAQELPAKPQRNYVAAKLKKEKSTLFRRGVGRSGRYIFSTKEFKWVAGGSFLPTEQLNGAPKRATWMVAVVNGERVMFVNAHAQNGASAAAAKARQAWTKQLLSLTFSRAKKHNVPRTNIFFGGDWNGTTGIISIMEDAGYVPTFKVAEKKANADLKSTSGFTGEPKKGDPIDMIFVHSSTRVTIYANYPHKHSDHSLIVSDIVL